MTPLLDDLRSRFLRISKRTAGALNDMYLTNTHSRSTRSSASRCRRLITAVDDTLAPFDYAKAGPSVFPGCASSPWTREGISYSGGMSM
jgi:hypothetical protein